MNKLILYISILLSSSWLSAQNIDAWEYFYDTDPGIGNATSLSANTNSGSLTQSFDLPLPTDATGFHRLYIRAKTTTENGECTKPLVSIF